VTADHCAGSARCATQVKEVLVAGPGLVKASRSTTLHPSSHPPTAKAAEAAEDDEASAERGAPRAVYGGGPSGQHPPGAAGHAPHAAPSPSRAVPGAAVLTAQPQSPAVAVRSAAPHMAVPPAAAGLAGRKRRRPPVLPLLPGFLRLCPHLQQLTLQGVAVEPPELQLAPSASASGAMALPRGGAARAAQTLPQSQSLPLYQQPQPRQGRSTQWQEAEYSQDGSGVTAGAFCCGCACSPFCGRRFDSVDTAKGRRKL
jgi:hypothetical protein